MDESSAEDEGQPEEGPSQKKQKLSRAQHGSMGGKLKGKVGDNRYVAGRAPDSRAKCRECGKNLVKGELRFGKIPPHAETTTYIPRTRWYHLECIFKSFKKVMSGTKTITSVEDIEGFEGFEGLDEDVKTRARELIEGASPQAPVSYFPNNMTPPE